MIPNLKPPLRSCEHEHILVTDSMQCASPCTWLQLQLSSPKCRHCNQHPSSSWRMQFTMAWARECPLLNWNKHDLEMFTLTSWFMLIADYDIYDIRWVLLTYTSLHNSWRYESLQEEKTVSVEVAVVSKVVLRTQNFKKPCFTRSCKVGTPEVWASNS